MTDTRLASAPLIKRARSTVSVVVIDDSALVRGLFARWLGEEPGLAVAGCFADGRSALEALATIDAEVAVLDIDMPVMDGLTALPLLLAARPGLRILIASTLTRRNAELGVRALALGAADYIAKPDADELSAASQFRRELVRRVRALGRQQRARRLRPFERLLGIAARPDQAARPYSSVRPKVLAIASSTGGPQALGRVLLDMGPALDRLPVLIAQHMPSLFTAFLAGHLADMLGRDVKEGEDGEHLRPGAIYLAPGGRHMALERRQRRPAIHVHDGPEVNFCRPSADPLFVSVARQFGPGAAAVVLTGMGKDGATGAKWIADAGGSVIAQDEATSVVWGMPRAAIAAGACAGVLPVGEIGAKLAALLGDRP